MRIRSAKEGTKCSLASFHRFARYCAFLRLTFGNLLFTALLQRLPTNPVRAELEKREVSAVFHKVHAHALGRDRDAKHLETLQGKEHTDGEAADLKAEGG